MTDPDRSVQKLVDAWTEWKACYAMYLQKYHHLRAVETECHKRAKGIFDRRLAAVIPIENASATEYLANVKELEALLRDGELAMADWTHFGKIILPFFEQLYTQQNEAYGRLCSARLPVLQLMNHALAALKVGDHVFEPTSFSQHFITLTEHVVTKTRIVLDFDSDLEFGISVVPTKAESNSKGAKNIYWSGGYCINGGCWGTDGKFNSTSLPKLRLLPRFAHFSDDENKAYLSALFTNLDVTICS